MDVPVLLAQFGNTSAQIIHGVGPKPAKNAKLQKYCTQWSFLTLPAEKLHKYRTMPKIGSHANAVGQKP